MPAARELEPVDARAIAKRHVAAERREWISHATNLKGATAGRPKSRLRRNPYPDPFRHPPPFQPLVVERVAEFPASIVRFSPDSAARLAKLARDSVRLQVAPGLEVNLWAPEGLISDPIGIGFDERGRMFVTRTARTNRDEIDIRAHPDWMVPSITFTDVEDKRAFYQRVLAPENSAKNQWLKDWNGDGSRDWHDLTFHKEGLYRLEDTNGDGIADFSQRILEDFHDLVTDVAHGVLAYKNDLYLTVSPDIWRLRDTNGDGVMDTKESLAHGSGVHIGFGGHGLSGPLIGPDGRLYWKQGDLGVNITTRDGRHLYNPNSGVIMRANLDGTEAEIFASGLRNPEEFAFDEYGNLISPDNDGDHPGELERVVYVVDGMDSGWRINWQFGKYVDPDNNTYKVWMDESLWKPRWAGQAAYITRPSRLARGPGRLRPQSGHRTRRHVARLLLRRRLHRNAFGSSIQGFTLAPQGAGFRLVEDKVVVKGLEITGVKFGPDGALYLADWIEGWDPKERGRIWKVDVAGGAARPCAPKRAADRRELQGKSPADLVALLRHPDMRVARRHSSSSSIAARRATCSPPRARRTTSSRESTASGGSASSRARTSMRLRRSSSFLKDGDPEIRAQAAKMLGDVRYAAPASELVPLLLDPVPRPRFFAAEALGRIKYQPAIQPLVAMLAETTMTRTCTSGTPARRHSRGLAWPSRWSRSRRIHREVCASPRSWRCAACATPASRHS